MEASPTSSKNGNTLKDLDNVYNKRLPARVEDFSAEYEKGISSEAASRENKFRQAEQAYKKAYVHYFEFLITLENRLAERAEQERIYEEQLQQLSV